MSRAEYSLVVVVPCFNEEARLPVEEILDWAERRPDWIWLLVDDGSRDGTRGVLESLRAQRDNLKCLFLDRNVGKAEAVRQGLLWAHRSVCSPWLSYLDADFSAPPAELDRMLGLHAHGPSQLVLGCRLQRLGASVKRRPLRHYLGRVAATLISSLLGLPTYDTQCGAKMIRTDLIPTVLAEPFLSRWLFDVELLARYRNFVGRAEVLLRVVEEPLVVWHERAGSKLRLRDFVRIPYELWCLHRRYNAENRRP